MKHYAKKLEPLNSEIVATIGADQTSLVDDQLGKVRDLCAAFPTGALRAAIDVHRLNCRQSSCPVLVAMVAIAGARNAGEEPTS